MENFVNGLSMLIMMKDVRPLIWVSKIPSDLVEDGLAGNVERWDNGMNLSYK